MVHGAGEPASRKASAALDRVVWRLVDGILLVCVLGMLVAVTVQVLARLWGFSAPWTEELSRFLFIWTAFFGMSVGFRHVQHPRIMLLLDILPSWCRALAVHFYVVAGISFFALVGWYAALLVHRQLTIGETSPVLGLGMFIVTLPSAVAAVLAILALVQTAYLDAATRARLEQPDEVVP
jgi:TRAP-type C4-dicarboxylate transport system permease small subunit